GTAPGTGTHGRAPGLGRPPAAARGTGAPVPGPRDRAHAGRHGPGRRRRAPDRAGTPALGWGRRGRPSCRTHGGSRATVALHDPGEPIPLARPRPPPGIVRVPLIASRRMGS